MTNQQKKWLDHHRNAGSPYHLMMKIMPYELGITEKECEGVVKEYCAEEGPKSTRNYRAFVVFESGVIVLLLLFVSIGMFVTQGGVHWIVPVLWLAAFVGIGCRLKYW